MVEHNPHIDSVDDFLYLLHVPVLGLVRPADHSADRDVPPENLLHGIAYFPDGGSGSRRFDGEGEKVALLRATTFSDGIQDLLGLKGSVSFK